jgi:hypothetical protein
MIKDVVGLLTSAMNLFFFFLILCFLRNLIVQGCSTAFAHVLKNEVSSTQKKLVGWLVKPKDVVDALEKMEREEAE